MRIMRRESISVKGQRVLAFVLVLGLAAIATPRTQAQTFSVIHSFTGGNDGAGPLAGFTIDAAGNLYGTTNSGGNSNAGTVFKVTRKGKETVLHSFAGGADGANPQASLVMDAAGDLYGTTNGGGAFGAGTVFRMTAGKRKETVLYSFAGGTDGANPQASLAMDAAGNLYGTTTAGGSNGSGTVFKLASRKKGRKWREQVLYSFGAGTDGTIPVAGVTFDKAGNLYGTTSAGGSYGNGSIFQLIPSRSGWTENVLYSFQLQSDGGVPYAGLVLDKAGNLYGAATEGGDGAGGGGTVFELIPSNGGWTFTVLYGLPGWGISGTFRNVLLDASGNIYATTHCDGDGENGTVYELTPSGGTWTYTSLYIFTGGSDGLYSFSNLVFDKHGNLYGTANQGGANGVGVVFKIAP
jgi:uncharacterized repeat protein (TIGR03803 family)